VIVIDMVPGKNEAQLAVFSTNVKVAVPAEVDPCATLPALVWVTLANAAGATTVARSEATSAALVPKLIAFFARFK
jgi:hypothetical protein